jgi:hypothetical protein
MPIGTIPVEIIHNGSFDNYSYWDFYNVDKKLEWTGCTIATYQSLTITDTVPPGVYQVLELADYEEKLSLDISFEAKYTVDVPDEMNGLRFEVHIYELTEYTQLPDGSIWTYELPTKYTDYKYRNEFVIYPVHANMWKEFRAANITLEPGNYIIGFTAAVFQSAENQGINNDYARYISKPLDALTLNNISCKFYEVNEVAFHDTLTNGSFESIDAPFDRWIEKGVTTSNVLNNNVAYPCPENLGKYCKLVKLNPDIDKYGYKEHCYGLNQIIQVNHNCTAEVRFWHRFDADSGSYARCYVYNLSGYDEEDNTFYINSVIHDFISVYSHSDWNYYQSFFPVVKDNIYMIQ